MSEEVKELIRKLCIYQINWLTEHCDIEFPSEEEMLIVRYLCDTTDRFIKEQEDEYSD